MKAKLIAFFDFEIHTTGKWFFLSLMTGVAAGAAAILFEFCAQAIHHYSLSALAHYQPVQTGGEHLFFTPFTGEFQPWMLLLVMTLGGLVSGLLVYHFAPETQGSGMDTPIDAFHNKQGSIPPRVPLVKLIASAVTLGTGGSAGREGPIAQIGAGIGSWISEKLHLSPRDRRILLATGMGAGVGAIFRAPLAAALFAGEILYRDHDLEADVFIPSAVSSTRCIQCVLPFSPARKKIHTSLPA